MAAALRKWGGRLAFGDVIRIQGQGQHGQLTRKEELVLGPE